MLLVITLFTLLLISSAYDYKDFNEKLTNSSYHKEIRPNNGKGPVNVTKQLYVTWIGCVNEKSFTFGIQYFHRQWWVDERLKSGSSTNVTRLILGKSLEDKLWLPDAFIVNSKETEKSADKVRTIVHSNGSIYMAQFVKVKATCPMDLTHFPMDRPNCSLTFESFSYSGEDVDLAWHKQPVIYDVKRGLDVVGYTLQRNYTRKFVQQQIVGEKVEKYVNVIVGFEFKRSVQYCIFRAYAPTMFLMVFAIGSFWIPHEKIPERMTMIVTTFLSLAVILQSVMEDTVHVSYTTGIQLFLAINVCFIVATVLEYLLVIKLISWKAMKEAKVSRSKLRSVGDSPVVLINVRSTDVEHHNEVRNANEHITNPTTEQEGAPPAKEVHFCDHISRKLFPLFYVVFCVSYFCLYRSWERESGVERKTDQIKEITCPTLILLANLPLIFQ